MIKYDKIKIITSDAQIVLEDGTLLDDIVEDIEMDSEGTFLRHRGYRFYLAEGICVGHFVS